MDKLLKQNNLLPTDDFALKLCKRSLQSFIDRYGIEYPTVDEIKQNRNMYDNRMRPRNIQNYYLMDRIHELEHEVHNLNRTIKKLKGQNIHGVDTSTQCKPVLVGGNANEIAQYLKAKYSLEIDLDD